MSAARRRSSGPAATTSALQAGAHPLDLPGPRAIADAAITVMSRHGYHGTSIRDIAEEAGMSSAALYHHFASKQDLLFQIMERGLDVLVRRTEEAFARAPAEPAERLRAIVRAHVLAHTEDRLGSFIGNNELRSLDPAHRAVVVAKRDQQQRLFDRVVADGASSGAFTCPYPKDAARAITTMCTAVAGWYKPGGGLTADEVADRYAEMAVTLVGTDPAPRRAAGRAANRRPAPRTSD